MAAYAADQYRESVQSSVYSTDSTYSPLSSILRNYPSVPEALSSNANPSGYHFPPAPTGTIPSSKYDPTFSSAARVPPDRRLPREGGDNHRQLHDGGDSAYDGSSIAHHYDGPATSVVPPTPTRQEAAFRTRVNPQHLSALSAISSYSQESRSEGNVRETWRSSSTSGAADPFSFRHFETPQVDPPRVVVSSTQAPQDNYVYAPTISLAPTAPAGRIPSKVTLQYNFSRPIRKESLGVPMEEPSRELGHSGMEMYSEDYRYMALPRNLPKTTPNPMYGDENFLQSSPSVSPHASPQISTSGSQLISSPARSPSPISLNSGVAQDLFYQRQYQQQEQRYSPPNYPPPDYPPNSENQMQADQLNVTRYSEDGTAHPPAPKLFVALPSSPPPLRPGSSYSLYSRYSFYSAGDLPSGSTTPQPGAYFDNREGSPSTRTPTPTRESAQQQQQQQQQQHLTASSSNQDDSTQPLNAHSHPQQPTENLDNPQTPHEFLALGILHHEANRLQESAYWFERAATENGGCGVGMLMWGLSLRHAWGTEKDEPAAFGWLRKAADAAVTDLERAKEKGERNAVKSELVLAIYEVGQCFFQGWGVETDKKMAVSYFKVAARLGDIDAQQELGFCYANGKGCKKDLKEAAKWYRAAAAQGASTVGLAWIYKPKYGGDKGSPKEKEKAKDRSKSPLNLLSPHPHTGSSIYSGTSTRDGPRKLRKPNPKLKSNPSSPRPSGVGDVLEVRNLSRVLQEEEMDREREVAW